MGHDEIRACVFDVYGTLLDFNSATQSWGEVLGDSAERVAHVWRAKQLEYAWVSTLTGVHTDFWACTQRGLDAALWSCGVAPAIRESLIESYKELEPFSEVSAALQMFCRRGARLAVLSNGTLAMINRALERVQLAEHFEACISIEDAQVFKPSPRAYALATERLNLPASAIAFFSSNAWDVEGARSFGLTPVWVNRAGGPGEYPLSAGVAEVRSLLDVW